MTKHMTEQQHNVATAERRLHKLEGNLTEVIAGAMTQNQWTRQDLARKTGIAHSTLSAIMVGTCGGRSWRLEHLMRLAVAFGVKLSDLILAAEQKDYTAFVLIAISGTEPQSEERLTKIIQCVAPSGTSPELLAGLYNAHLMRAVAPQYVDSYLSGQIGDQKVHELLFDVSSSMEEGDNFWAKFATHLLRK